MITRDKGDLIVDRFRLRSAMQCFIFDENAVVFLLSILRAPFITGMHFKRISSSVIRTENEITRKDF